MMSYTYDLNGNRTGTGYHTTVMNEMTNSPGNTYTYDNAGNMISDNNGTTITTYTYDYRNRLTEVTQGGTIVATYTYNALNQRIGIKDNGTQTWTVYDGMSADAHPYADFNSSGSFTMRYLSAPGVFNGAMMSVILARTSSSGTIAWYLTDRLGSVRDIVSTSGTELDHIVYDSFGNIVTETDATNGDRFKFAGMEFDTVTGQYYDRARNYDAVIGRFMRQDSRGFGAGDPNLYRAVHNAPTNATDPSGETLVTAGIGAAIGAIIGAAYETYSYFQGDGEFNVGTVIKTTLIGAAAGSGVPILVAGAGGGTAVGWFVEATRTITTNAEFRFENVVNVAAVGVVTSFAGWLAPPALAGPFLTIMMIAVYQCEWSLIQTVGYLLGFRVGYKW